MHLPLCDILNSEQGFMQQRLPQQLDIFIHFQLFTGIEEFLFIIQTDGFQTLFLCKDISVSIELATVVKAWT